MVQKILNKRALQKQKTRLKILAAAKSLLAEKGISDLKTLEVAEKAGISHGAVFVHFPSKEALLIQVIESFGSLLIKRIHKSSEDNRGLRSVLEAHLIVLQEHEVFYAALIDQAKRLPTPARETLIAIQSAVSFHIANAAGAEMSTKAIKTMPAYLLFNTWLGLIHYYLSNKDLFSPHLSVLEDKGEELIRHFMHLITF